MREVQFGAKADRATQSQDGAIVYANKRAEMWGLMREWLPGGTIENNPDLIADLTGVEYGYVLREGRDAIQLEKKEDMRKRGLASPDRGDSLALTFAYPVAFSDHSRIMRTGAQHVSDWEPFRDMFNRRASDHPAGGRYHDSGAGAGGLGDEYSRAARRVGPLAMRKSHADRFTEKVAAEDARPVSADQRHIEGAHG